MYFPSCYDETSFFISMEDAPIVKGTISLSPWPEGSEGGASGEANVLWQQMCLPHPGTTLLVAKAGRAAAAISIDAPRDACSEVSPVAYVPRSGWMLRSLGPPPPRAQAS